MANTEDNNVSSTSEQLTDDDKDYEVSENDKIGEKLDLEDDCDFEAASTQKSGNVSISGFF